MAIQYFDNLKKSMHTTGENPHLLANLIDEMRFFFQMIRIKLESGDTEMRANAAAELKELRLLIEKHPAIHAAVQK